MVSAAAHVEAHDPASGIDGARLCAAKIPEMSPASLIPWANVEVPEASAVVKANSFASLPALRTVWWPALSANARTNPNGKILLRGSHMPLHLLAACDALWDFVQMSWIVNLLELPISGHQKSVNRDVSRSTGAVAVRSHDVALGVDAP